MRFVILVCVLFCLAVPALAADRPPQFPTPPQSPEPPIPACKCGCMETGECKCKNCCERTGDPTWKPSQSAKALAQKSAPAVAAAGHYEDRQVCENGKCRIVRVFVPPTGDSVYGSRPVGDFIYDPTDDQPSQPSSGGGCANGSCGSGATGARAGFHPVRNFFNRLRNR